jgi:mannose-6-phosphate isomerase-like protein (cupin superfamily)
MQPDVVRNEDGERLDIGPTVTLVKVPGTGTGQRFGVVQMRIPGGFAGPPPHLHGSVDHLWVVQEGELDLTVDGRAVRARAGDLGLVPAGTSHTFSTALTGPALLLEVDLGRALDGYLRDLRDALGAGVVDPVAVAAVMRSHDTVPVLETARS